MHKKPPSKTRTMFNSKMTELWQKFPTLSKQSVQLKVGNLITDIEKYFQKDLKTTFPELF